jgi:crotonobetainyl-CoA:carnitine CoA-transferase CaiB-like acyl-CoA transferase
VLVQNLRPGALASLGYSWDALRARNPRLIYAEMTGFGHTGPRAADAAYDPLMQAYSGLMSLTGEAGRPPVRIPVSILDKGTGMWTAIGVLNALRNRDASGVGSLVQTSLLDTALQWEPTQLLGYVATGETPEPTGSGAAMIAPYQAFPAADGHVIVAAGNERLWVKLCTALQRPELVVDARFADNASRVRNRDELTATLTWSLAQQPVAHWVKVLGEAGVPCTPILKIDAVLEEDQVHALGSLERVDHPDLPEYTLVHLPVVTNGARFAIRSVAPRLDAHGDAIRVEVGRDE